MHNLGTLSCPFLSIFTPEGKNMLPTRLIFETKLIYVEDYYEIKVRMWADGSKMVQGLDHMQLW